MRFSYLDYLIEMSVENNIIFYVCRKKIDLIKPCHFYKRVH